MINSTDSASNNSLKVLLITFILMVFAELFFLVDIFADFLLIDLTSGIIDHNTLEFSAVILLAVSLVALSFQLRMLLQINNAQQEALQAASGELLQVIEKRFVDWKLSASEKQVALLLIKGLSIQEICDVRNTKAGTVKSQANAVYQKSGLQNRAELVSYFVEDLLAGESLISDNK